MISKLLPLLIVSQLMVSQALAGFASPLFWLGSGLDGGLDVDIVDFETTLLLPSPPQFPAVMDGAIWVGLLTGEGDFIQSLFQPSPNSPCDNDLGQWCAYGYAVDCPPANPNNCNNTWVAAQKSNVEGNAAYNVHYARHKSKNNITQTISKDGAILSLLTKGSGQGKALQFTAECHVCQSVAMPAYDWVNTTIVLDRPEMAFGTPHVAQDVSYGNFYTPDNGKTWKLDWLHLNEAMFPQHSQRDIQQYPSGPSPLPSSKTESSRMGENPSGLIARDDNNPIRFGPGWGGKVDPEHNFIEEVETTIVLPHSGDPQYARLALWPGLYTTGDDLVQTIAVSTDWGGQRELNCQGIHGQWCLLASIWRNHSPGGQLMAKATAVNPGTQVAIHYLYDDSTGNTVQTAKVDGNVVSELSTSSGKPYNFFIEVECQAWCYGKIEAHSYLYTTIRLNQPDMGYKDAVEINGHNVTHADLETHDGGKTWYISWIHVDESWFDKLPGW